LGGGARSPIADEGVVPSHVSVPLLAGSKELAPLLEVAIEHLHDGILVTEGDGPAPRRIVYVNRGFTRMTGFAFHEAVGKTPEITVGPDTDRAALGRIQVARAEKRAAREELLKYRKDGTTFWVEIDVIPVLGDGGAVTNYLGVMREITERKALQTRVLEADRLASLGTLVAGIAHEINNPLSYILANLKFVAEILGAPQGPAGLTLAPDEVKELRTALEEVELGAERVKRIVRDLRIFARAESAKAEPVDLAEIVSASLKLARAEIGERALVVQEIEGCGKVLGDPSRLGQVFVNLLLNAGQAIPETAPMGRIEIRGRREDKIVRVTVTDNGVGISPQNMGRIFQPFFTTKQVGVGTGLGLPICQSIVDALGGRITVASVLGAGTTVTLELVAVDADVSPP
jgi:PAS domain S-box-containing protein